MSRAAALAAALLWLPAAAAGQASWPQVHGSVSELRQASRFQEAAELLAGWIDDHPRDEEARLVLGEVLAEAGRPAAAVEVWTRMLEELSPDLERYRSVSARMAGLGHVEEGLAVLREGARRVDGDDPFSWERAELALRLDRFEEVLAAHLEFLRQHPWRLPLVENRIADMVRGGSGEGRDAADPGQGYLQAAENALARAEGETRVLAARLAAAASLETGRSGRGVRALGRALPGEGALQALYSFASRCEARGDAAAAAEAYALIAAHGGDSAQRYRSLLKQAEMREVLGDGDGAVELYTRLAAGHPRRGEAAEALLRAARLQAGGHGTAAEAMETLSTLERRAVTPDLQRRWLGLRAECHILLDDLPAARRELRRLAALEGGRAEAAYHLGLVAFYQGDFENAEALVDSMVTASPSDPLANDALALLLLLEEFGHQPEALAVLARARLRQRQQRTQEAEAEWQWLLTEAPAALRQAVRLERARDLEDRDPVRALALYVEAGSAAEDRSRAAVTASMGRARVLEGLGEAGEALRLYEQTLLASPEDSRAPEIRRRIEELRRLLEPSG